MTSKRRSRAAASPDAGPGPRTRSPAFRWERISPLPAFVIRLAVKHFAELAAGYEGREGGTYDPSEKEFIEDIANRLLEHEYSPLLTYGRFHTVKADLEALQRIYRAYSRREIDRDALLLKLRDYFRARDVILSEGQEKMLTPSRRDLSNQHNGPSTFAREMIGMVFYKVNGKTIHNWLKKKGTLRLLPPFGVIVSDESVADYFVKYVHPGSDSPLPEPTRVSPSDIPEDFLSYIPEDQLQALRQMIKDLERGTRKARSLTY